MNEMTCEIRCVTGNGKAVIINPKVAGSWTFLKRSYTRRGYMGVFFKGEFPAKEFFIALRDIFFIYCLENQQRKGSWRENLALHTVKFYKKR